MTTRPDGLPDRRVKVDPDVPQWEERRGRQLPARRDRLPVPPRRVDDWTRPAPEQIAEPLSRILDGIRDEVREAVIEGDANDCTGPDCIADAVYEIVRVRLRDRLAAIPAKPDVPDWPFGDPRWTDWQPIPAKPDVGERLDGFYVTADALADALYAALGWSTARYRPSRAHRPDDYATYDPIPEGIVSGDRDHEDWANLTASVLRSLTYAALSKEPSE